VSLSFSFPISFSPRTTVTKNITALEKDYEEVGIETAEGEGEEEGME